VTLVLWFTILQVKYETHGTSHNYRMNIVQDILNKRVVTYFIAKLIHFYGYFHHCIKLLGNHSEMTVFI
jgi:hypothetical protein